MEFRIKLLFLLPERKGTVSQMLSAVRHPRNVVIWLSVYSVYSVVRKFCVYSVVKLGIFQAASRTWSSSCLMEFRIKPLFLLPERNGAMSQMLSAVRHPRNVVHLAYRVFRVFRGQKILCVFRGQ